MVWSLVSPKRRRKLIEDAERSRADRIALFIAWTAVIIYNVVGFLDIFSTHAGISAGLAEEINPAMRLVMEHFGPGWIAAKLFLQFVISAMVLWFPHRIVLAIFIAAVAFNAGIVFNNLQIAGLI